MFSNLLKSTIQKIQHIPSMGVLASFLSLPSLNKRYSRNTKCSGTILPIVTWRKSKQPASFHTPKKHYLGILLTQNNWLVVVFSILHLLGKITCCGAILRTSHSQRSQIQSSETEMIFSLLQHLSWHDICFRGSSFAVPTSKWSNSSCQKRDKRKHW